MRLPERGQGHLVALQVDTDRRTEPDVRGVGALVALAATLIGIGLVVEGVSRPEHRTRRAQSQILAVARLGLLRDAVSQTLLGPLAPELAQLDGGDLAVARLHPDDAAGLEGVLIAARLPKLRLPAEHIDPPLTIGAGLHHRPAEVACGLFGKGRALPGQFSQRPVPRGAYRITARAFLGDQHDIAAGQILVPADLSWALQYLEPLRHPQLRPVLPIVVGVDGDDVAGPGAVPNALAEGLRIDRGASLRVLLLAQQDLVFTEDDGHPPVFESVHVGQLPVGGAVAEVDLTQTAAEQHLVGAANRTLDGTAGDADVATDAAPLFRWDGERRLDAPRDLQRPDIAFPRLVGAGVVPGWLSAYHLPG